MFERENRRERILEARNREIRLKAKATGSESHLKGPKEDKANEHKAQAEADFYAIVEKVRAALYKLLFSSDIAFWDYSALSYLCGCIQRFPHQLLLTGLR